MLIELGVKKVGTGGTARRWWWQTESKGEQRLRTATRRLANE